MNIKVEKFLKFSWLILCPLISTFSVKAGEWSVDANIRQDISYDDNVKMRENENDQEASLIYNVTPVINFAHRTDVSEISANASYGFEKFFDSISDFDEDRDIQRYGIKGLYSMTERIDWGISADYSIAPGRDSAADDSGDFGANFEKRTFSILPSVTYQLTEQDSLVLSGGYIDTRYSKTGNQSVRPPLTVGDNVRGIDRPLVGPDPDLIEWATSRLLDGEQSDYESMNVALNWSRSWSERFNSSLGFSYSKYESERNVAGEVVTIEDSARNAVSLTTDSKIESTTSDTYAITLSSSYMILEKWELYGEVGGRFTKTKDNVDHTNSDSAGFVFDVGTIYTGESLLADFSIGQSTAPSSRGREEERFRVSLDLNYIITERLSTALRSSYQNSKSIGSASNERKNFSVQPSLSWRIDPDWSVSTSYRYRYQKRPIGGETETANSNLYMISLNYRWQGLSISR